MSPSTDPRSELAGNQPKNRGWCTWVRPGTTTVSRSPRTRVERLRLFGCRRGELRGDIARLDLRLHRQPIDGRAVVGDPVDQLVAGGAELVGRHRRGRSDARRRWRSLRTSVIRAIVAGADLERRAVPEADRPDFVLRSRHAREQRGQHSAGRRSRRDRQFARLVRWMGTATVGTAAGRFRTRASARCAEPAARDVPVEGRRPGRRRAEHQDRRVEPDPRRTAQAPGRGGGREVHRLADRCAARRALGGPWAARPTDDDDDVWVFGSAADDSPAELYALYDGAVQRSQERLAAALAGGGLDQLVHIQWGDLGRLSLRRILFDLLEEYGRHTGHADLLREAVDGRVGEDPPGDWRPPRAQRRSSCARCAASDLGLSVGSTRFAVAPSGTKLSIAVTREDRPVKPASTQGRRRSARKPRRCGGFRRR